MKGLGIRWSKPQLKGLDNIHTNAAAGKICQSFLSVLSLCQARMEEPGRQLIGPDDFFFLLLPTDFLSRLFQVPEWEFRTYWLGSVPPQQRKRGPAS